MFIETTESTQHLRSYLDDDSYAALQAFLAANPDAGDIVRGTGGIRKLRWRSKGRGKRGGSRIIYYWLVAEDHNYLLTVCGKEVKDDLTPAQRAAWRRVVAEIENG